MATKLLVCPDCASDVAPGRFACTSCGALLASVASAPRALGGTEALTPPAVSAAPPSVETHVPVEPDTHASNGHGGTIGPAWAHGPLERAADETEMNVAVDGSSVADGPTSAETTAASVPDPAAPDDAIVASSEPGPNVQFDGNAELARDDAPLALAHPAELAAGDDAPGATAPEPAATVVEPPPIPEEPLATPDEPGAPLAQPPIAASAAFRVDEPRPSDAAGEPSWPEARGWPPPGAAQPAPLPAPRPRAGAYLPPSAVLTTVGEAAEASSLNGSGPAPAAGPALAGSAGSATDAVSRSRRLLAIDPAFPPQAVVVGASIATLGFLMPWAPIVIGSTHTGGYLDQWGLAAPGHAALLLVIIALGAAASQVDRLPDWARPGLPAVIVSGILVGLVWPYLLIAGFQPTIGVYLTLTASVVLVAGGLLDLWVTRHAGASRAV